MSSVLFLNPDKDDSYYRSILPSYYLSKICGIQSSYFWIKDVNCLNNYNVIVITVNSKRLFKVYKKFHSHIHIVQDYIDLDSWKWGNNNHNSKKNIGIIIPKDYRSDVNYISKGIEKISKTFDVNFKFFSYKLKNIKIKNSKIIHYNSMMDYINCRENEKCGIMLSPLSPSKFNLSRSHINILESWASHSLVMATNWGTYARIIENGNGFLIDKDKSWFEKFKYVFEHYDKLSKLVLSKSQDYLVKYDIKVNIHKWKQSLMR